jgi:hypothetical protein
MPKHPPFAGTYAITTGWQYSTGALHAATDYGTPIGTPLYAIRDGTVADCNDGVANNVPGVNPGSGADSNWVLLWVRDDDAQPRTVYYQHMSPGLNVTKGQGVKAGYLLGHSGNTGNSTGPHFHCSVTEGHTYERYLYMENGGALAVYPPANLWEEDDMPLSDEDLDKIAARVWNYKLELNNSNPPRQYQAGWFLSRIQELSKDTRHNTKPSATATSRPGSKPKSTSKKTATKKTATATRAASAKRTPTKAAGAKKTTKKATAGKRSTARMAK